MKGWAPWDPDCPYGGWDWSEDERVLPSPPGDAMITVPEAEVMCGCTRGQIYYALKRGVFPGARKDSHRHWLIPRGEVLRWCE